MMKKNKGDPLGLFPCPGRQFHTNRMIGSGERRTAAAEGERENSQAKGLNHDDIL